MKIGVKTYDNADFLHQFKKNADFFEIMAVQDNDYSFLGEFSKAKPIVVHAEHQAFGTNPADKSKEIQDKGSIKFAQQIANLNGTEKIVIHPGRIENTNCKKENAINFIKSLKDKRILIENLPSENSLCKTPDEVKEFMKKTKCGFCFDINHAIISAINQKKDYIKFLKEFIKLKPSHYHFGGQKIAEKKDSHLSLAESEIDLKEIIKLLPKNAEITLETEQDIEKTEQDIKIIKNMIKQI